MSTALSTVQAVYAAFGAGDLPALLSHLHPDVQWQFVGDHGAPYTGRVQGHEAVAHWFGDVAKADAIQAFEPREFLASAEHVTVLGWERTAATSSGRVFETEWVHVWTLREGKVARFFGIFDTQAAAEARVPA